LNCFQASINQYQYWISYTTVQKELRESSPSSIHLRALFGILSKENEEKLRLIENSYFVSVGGNPTSLFDWNLTWNPANPEKYNYFAETKFVPKDWDDKEIYQVFRKFRSNWFGFFPSDFVNAIQSSINELRNNATNSKILEKSRTFQFLCETFECSFQIDNEEIIFTFSFSEETKKRFPDFYKFRGSRLEKSTNRILIRNPKRDKDWFVILNNGKVISIKFPKAKDPDYFQNVKDFEIITNIEIKAFGIIVNINQLIYKLNLTKVKNGEILIGKFDSVKSQTISGKFLYVIPTGIIDFFIPGNLQDYLQTATRLQVYGTQGLGGSQFRAKFIRDGKIQQNETEFYAESQRKRFSLFGSDSPEEEKASFLFFAKLEENLLKDLLPK